MPLGAYSKVSVEDHYQQLSKPLAVIIVLQHLVMQSNNTHTKDLPNWQGPCVSIYATTSMQLLHHD